MVLRPHKDPVQLPHGTLTAFAPMIVPPKDRRTVAGLTAAFPGCEEKIMTDSDIFGLIVGIGVVIAVFGYLAHVMRHPERF